MPEVDKYHVRIDTEIARLALKLVTHMSLAYTHTMEADLDVVMADKVFGCLTWSNRVTPDYRDV
jgi:hypothetical protein